MNRRLYGRDVKTIGKHISNALKEELEPSTVAKFATVQMEGDRTVKREVEYDLLEDDVYKLFLKENTGISAGNFLISIVSYL